MNVAHMFLETICSLNNEKQVRNDKKKSVNKEPKKFQIKYLQQRRGVRQLRLKNEKGREQRAGKK